ncbi:hypothetical protein [Chitinophaga sp.]|uniref:hypothetical protein n=1 Tax=Chitinophaga sp. TaxID=1869181 RepID=UPI002F933886
MSRRSNQHRFKIYQAFKEARKGEDLNTYEEPVSKAFFETIGREAAINAINENKAMNLPVTFVRDGWVVREMPDGRQERISQIALISLEAYKKRNLIKGTVIHVGKKR